MTEMHRYSEKNKHISTYFYETFARVNLFEMKINS